VGPLKFKNMKKYNIVLHCTENYLQNSLNLIESLRLFHDNLNFYLYTVNFFYKTDSKDINSIPFNFEGIENNMSFVGNKNDITNKNMFKSVFLKSKIVLHTLENMRVSEAIYIDSDMIPTGEITSLFEFLGKIDDYPLIQQSVYEYQINYGRGNPFHKGGFDETNILEYPLMNFHHVPMKNRTHYSVSSVMLYNQNCKQFFREYDWVNNMAYDMDLEDIRYYYPFSDETTINVLLWKYGFRKRIQRSQMNIDELSNIKEYYESNYDQEKEITGYVRVPSKLDRNKILFFHGAKGELSNSILKLQKNLFDIRLDIQDNKVFINPTVDFNRVFKIEFVSSDNKIFYTQFSKFNLGLEFWYSPNTKFEEVKNFQVLIYDEERLIYKKKY
jgi:hypothetical protein